MIQSQRNHKLRMKRSAILIGIILLKGIGARAQSDSLAVNDLFSKKRKLIYTADFRKELDKKKWLVEMKPAPGSSVYEQDRKLIIDTKEGVTVWLTKRLKGNILIEYKRAVIMDGKENDRLSDLNQFWMATDPRNPNLFKRNGMFEEYDSLQLYYVGMGGNANTTTRFRKYQGNGEKTLLQEYTDEGHLLKAGKKYAIKIIIHNGVTSFWVDGECYFAYQDPHPLREGYFGFRSTHSRQIVEDLKIYKLL
jgi:hypothetical protein